MRFRTFLQVMMCVGALPLLAAQPVATVDLDGNALRFTPLVNCGSVSVAVVGPSYELRRVLSSCLPGRVELGEMPDGDYRFEVRVAVGTSGDPVTRDAGEATGAVSGAFTVRAGRIVRPSRSERPATSGTESSAPGPDDWVIADDLIAYHGCFSSDQTCANFEPFGSEDVKLKGGAPGLLFEDTSPDPQANDDWEIATGPTTVEELHILHVDSGNRPFTISGGAANDAIFVDAEGDVGFGTATPNGQAQVDVFGDLHLTNATSSWRVFNNPTYFGIRDLAAVDAQFAISATAPTYSVILTPGGVGVGTAAPASKLHVQGGDGTTQLRVEETSATAVGRNLARFVNNGAATFRFDNTQTGGGWGFGSRQVGDFFVSPIGAATITLTLTTAGNMTILGALTQGSDRNSKADIEGVDPAEVLAKVAGLPIATWRYKDDQATHVGPMAQDFHAAFGLGADDKHIAPADMAGLGLAAIQALKAEVAEKEARIRALEQRLERLEAAQNP